VDEPQPANSAPPDAVPPDAVPPDAVQPDAVPPAGPPPGGRGRSWLRGLALLVVLAFVVGAVGWAAAGGIVIPGVNGPTGGTPSGATPGAPTSSPDGAATPTPEPPPTPTPMPPLGGTELYGYLPYWQMTDNLAPYLDRVPVSTMALFSVSVRKNGHLKTGEVGYLRITGDRGRALIAAAHARGQRVELAFTSFGYDLNTRLFGDDDVALQRRGRAAQALLALVGDLGLDGLNIDVERVDGDIGLGYADFLASLRTGLDELGRGKTLSVATTAGHQGATLALDAVDAGADRVFLMGYDYHWTGSGAGASSPVHNRDSGIDLTSSITDYVETGVPRDRIILGLPLYGMSWPVAGPGRAADVLGHGSVWIPANHRKMLLATGFSPAFDVWEIADYFVEPEGDAWRATYYDSPRTLVIKMTLAREQGLAGAGFWALGYEAGLPGYVELMRDFAAGRVGS
jgi:hypothetical protein